MASYLDNCRFVPQAGGLADWEVSAAVQGYMDDIEAGAVDQIPYHVRAQSADLSQWEISEGLYDLATRTFARTTILYSSAGGAKVNFTAVPECGVVLLARDIPRAYTGDLAPTLDAPDDSFYVQRANQDFWMRENGVWVRKGNIRDEGAGGIVGTIPVIGLGFNQDVTLSRIRYLGDVAMALGLDQAVAVDLIKALSATVDEGFAMSVALSRIKAIAAAMDFGFTMDVTVTVSDHEALVVDPIEHGFNMSVVVERIRFLAATEHALGYSQANDLTHAPAENKYLVITDTASPWMRVFDASLNKYSDPTTTPGGVTVQIACTANQFAIARNNGTFYVYDVSASAVTLAAGPISTAATNIRAMAYNPDGTRLLVVFGNGTPWVEVYETSGWTKVTAPAPGQQAQGGDWSPDGSEIALALVASPYVKLYQTSDMTAISNPSSVMTHQALQAWYSASHLVYSEGAISPHAFWIYDRSDLSRVSTGTQPTGLISSQRKQFSKDGSRFFWGQNASPRINVYSVSGNTFSAQTVDTDVTTSVYGMYMESDNATLHVLEAGSTSMIWRRYTWSGSQWEQQTNPGNQPAGSTILGVVNGTL